MILCICTVKVELVQYSEQISLLASCRFTNFCHRLWKDAANGTHLMIQQILKCLQVTRSVSASTLRSWPLRHDLNVQFVLAYPPESRPGWLLWRHLDLLKREMQVVWSNRYLVFFEYLHLLTQNDENPHFFGTQIFHVLFFVGLVNLRSLRFGNSEKIYDIIMIYAWEQSKHPPSTRCRSLIYPKWNS